MSSTVPNYVNLGKEKKTIKSSHIPYYVNLQTTVKPPPFYVNIDQRSDNNKSKDEQEEDIVNKDDEYGYCSDKDELKKESLSPISSSTSNSTPTSSSSSPSTSTDADSDNCPSAKRGSVIYVEKTEVEDGHLKMVRRNRIKNK
ncbi:unnamed protein product [Dimorphilus gyrociliatus]|uniref:Uncharacterized protein n=1 Tax=Dimorphilus gyrociliatus TaxID=2664684 RepID=A0A7I8VLX0_9ANNE|nr:unnamed protein product [Dimorphilus gyrociliatus]